MRSRRAPVRRQEQRPDVLSERDEDLLKRLFSDPTKYPQTLKTWIISWLEGSDLSLPMYSVNGLKDRLADASGQSVIGGRGPYTTDASGRVTIVYPTNYTVVNSVVVSSHGGPGLTPPASNIATCTYNVTGFTLSSFEVTVWDVNLNAPYASKPVFVSWLAHVTP